MELGIIGLPNVGKSTLFNALTSNKAPASPYPFCTVEPNVGITGIPDNRLNHLARAYKPQKLTPATIKFIDVAGLVKGASHGEGLGNKFLSHIRNVDAIIHVLRTFADSQVASTYEGISPLRDMEIVNTELILADLDVVERNASKFEKLAKSGDKEASKRLSLLGGIKDGLERGIPVRLLKSEREMGEYQFLTDKPVLYIINKDDNDCHTIEKELFDKIKEEKSEVLPISVKIEEELAQLDAEERERFRSELGINKSSLESLVLSSFRLLDLILFYTVVGTEVRAWAIKKDTSALKAAGKIHSDMEKGFIKAEVFSYEDFSRYPDEKTLHEKGLVHLEGRDYRIQDGDIVLFRFKA